MTEHAVADYYQLSPERVLDAVESLGFAVDGRFIVLNSYENRVYQVHLDNAEPIIAKFYRPQRWSDEAIREEHRFTRQLVEQELPIIAPWHTGDGETLFDFQGYRFTLYPRRGGQAPEPGDLDQLYRLGSMLGRIHAFGATQTFDTRPTLSIDSYCKTPAQFLLQKQFIPSELRDNYTHLIHQIIESAENTFNHVSRLTYIRTHSDFHLSNIIWTRDDGPYILDFDDCRMAPAVQDIWMLLSGDRAQRTTQLSEVLEGYQNFYDFNTAELPLIETLRTLRMVHYAGWLATRWTDPAFPQHFPWFNTPHYWQQHMTELTDQLGEMQAPALQVFG